MECFGPGEERELRTRGGGGSVGHRTQQVAAPEAQGGRRGGAGRAQRGAQWLDSRERRRPSQTVHPQNHEATQRTLQQL